MRVLVVDDAERVLRDCRSTVMLLRQQEATLIHLMTAKAVSAEEEAALQMQVAGFQQLLEGTRERYRRAVVAAVCVLGSLTGRDYDILCLYYVLGMSLSEISRKLQCNVRTVTRGKARALMALRAESPAV